MNCPVTKPKEWQSIMSATSLSEEEAWAKARSDAARLAEHILSVMESAATSVYSLTPGRVPSWVLSESLALVADDHRVITVPAGSSLTRLGERRYMLGPWWAYEGGGKATVGVVRFTGGACRLVFEVVVPLR